MADEIDTSLLLRIEATLAKFEKQMAKAQAVAAGTSNDIQGRLDAMSRRMGASAERAASVLTAALDRAEAGYRDVISAIDPAAAASQRLALQEEKLAEALKRGVISAEEHARVLGLVQAEYRQTAAALDPTVRALERQGQEAAKASAAYHNLIASLDPAAAAAQQLAARQQLLGRALDAGAIDAAEHARAMRLVKNEYDLATTAITRQSAATTQGMSGLFRVSSAGRFVLQNTANQLGDVAVQLQMGTAASRVAAQQLPQLLGGFGALGGALGLVAPLLGTVAAIGIPVAAALFAMGSNSEEAAKQVEEFEKRLRAAQSALNDAEQAIKDASAEGLETLRERYHSITAEITGLASALESLAISDAKGKVGGLVDAIFPDLKGRPEQIRKAVSDYERLSARLQEVTGRLQAPATLSQPEFDALDNERKQLQATLAQLQPIRDEIEKIGDALNLLPQEASALALALADAKQAIQAKDFDAAAKALAAMRQYAQSVGITFDEDILTSITSAEDLAAQMAARLKDSEANAKGAADAAGGLKDPIATAADEAARLSGNLALAMSTLARVTADLATAQRRAANQAAVIRAAGGDPAKKAEGMAREAFNESTGSAAYELIRGGRSAQLGQLADVGRGTAELARQEAENKRIEDKLDQAFKGAGKKGGGGGKNRITDDNIGEKEILQLQQRIELLGKTQEETARLEARYRLLEEAKRAGLDLDKRNLETGLTLREQIDAQAEAIGRYTQELDHAKDRADFFKSVQGQIKDGFLDAAASGESFSDTLRTVAEMLKRAALEALIFRTGPLAGGGGGGGGFFGGLLSGLTSLFGGRAKLPGRAAGGAVLAGHGYWTGENGPEPFVPAVNGRILSTSQAQQAITAAAGRGRDRVDVQVHGGDLTLTDGGQIAARISVSARVTQQRTMGQVRRELPGMVRTIEQDGRFA